MDSNQIARFMEGNVVKRCYPDDGVKASSKEAECRRKDALSKEVYTESLNIQNAFIFELFSLVEDIARSSPVENMQRVITKRAKEGDMDCRKFLLMEKIGQNCQAAYDNETRDKIRKLRKEMIFVGCAMRMMAYNLCNDDIDGLSFDSDAGVDKEHIKNEDYLSLTVTMQRMMLSYIERSSPMDTIIKIGRTNEVNFLGVKRAMICFGCAIKSLGLVLKDDQILHVIYGNLEDSNYDLIRMLSMMMKRHLKREYCKELRGEFKVFDPEESGFVHLDEFRQVLRKVGGLLKENTENYLNEIKINNADKVNYVEYLDAICDQYF